MDATPTTPRRRRPPLRQRVRDAGGLYLWINKTLISWAGPAQIGEGRGTPCTRCGAYKNEHTARDGMLYCPGE